MGRVRETGGRRALQLVNLVLGVSLVTGFLGLVLAQQSQLVIDWLGEMKGGLIAQDLAESALEEASFELMRSVNDPDDPAFLLVRGSGLADVQFEAALPRAKKLAAGFSSVRSLGARVLIHRKRSLGAVTGRYQEWTGYAQVTARAELGFGRFGQRRKSLVASQVREVKTVSIAPPKPLDSYAHYEWRAPLPGQVDGPFFADRAFWADHKATLRIASAMPGGVQAAYASLTDALATGGSRPPVNGVVYVDNGPGDPLRIKNVVHRGKTVLVTRGPVELGDVRMEDPSRDHLTLIAFGSAKLGGDVEATVIFTRDAADPEPERICWPGTTIRGALVVTCGDYRLDGGGQLDPRPLCPDRSRTELSPRHLYVAVSPTVLVGDQEVVQ